MDKVTSLTDPHTHTDTQTHTQTHTKPRRHIQTDTLSHTLKAPNTQTNTQTHTHPDRGGYRIQPHSYRNSGKHTKTRTGYWIYNQRRQTDTKKATHTDRLAQIRKTYTERPHLIAFSTISLCSKTKVSAVF